MADVLRIDLLSRYGGVWADVTTCPVQPIDSYIGDKTKDVGFFAMMWENFYARQTSGNHTLGALGFFDKDAPCVKRDRADTQGYHTIDNWFLMAPQPHNQIIDTWLEHMVKVVDDLPDGAKPCRPKAKVYPECDYVYHLPMCVIGQLYAENATMRMLMDQMPAESLCQHGENASPRCNKVLDAVAEEERPESVYDKSLDMAKYMYKSVTSMGITEDEYEAWIMKSTSDRISS